MSDSTEIKVIRKDAAMLAAFKVIFGDDLVVNAWRTTYFWDDHPSDSINDAVSRLNYPPCKTEDTGQSVSYDAETIWLEFSNGRVVQFENSEWASIGLADYANAKEIPE